MCCLLMFVFFFFKQKTAYEMRISDWSSDVCSSDLFEQFRMRAGAHEVHQISLDRVDEQEVAADMALAMIAPIAFEGVVQPFRAKRRVVGDEEHHRFLSCFML